MLTLPDCIGHGFQGGAGYATIFDRGVIRVLRASSGKLIALYSIRGGADTIAIDNDGIVNFIRSDGTITVSIVPTTGSILPPDGLRFYNGESYLLVARDRTSLTYFCSTVEQTSVYNNIINEYLPTTAYADPGVGQMLDISSPDGNWLLHWTSILYADGNPGIFGPKGLLWNAGERTKRFCNCGMGADAEIALIGMGFESSAGYNTIFDHGVIRVLRSTTQELIALYSILNGGSRMDIGNDGILRFYRSDNTVTVSIIPGIADALIPAKGLIWQPGEC